MNRAAFLLVSFVCLVWALVFACVQSPVHAASRNTAAFQREWDASKVDLKTSSEKFSSSERAATSKKQRAGKTQAEKKQAKRHKRRGSSTPPDFVEGDNQKQSERAVCRSQCSLERMSCDQGRDSFQNRADQLRAAQSSCFLASQSCLSRC